MEVITLRAGEVIAVRAVRLAGRWLPDVLKRRLRPILYRWLLGRSVDERIAIRTRGKHDVFFVQIGSNDGVQGDPLHPHIVANKSWQGIFVEPVKFAFDRLKGNYNNDPRFVFLNVAISDHGGKLPFFYLAESAKLALPDLPFWYDQLGSFNPQHIVSHLGDSVIPFVVEESVESVKLTEVLSGVVRIDILHIDTEGYDYRILSQIPFATLPPDLIIFEHFHLAEGERKAARCLLQREGYRIAEVGTDTIATRRSFLGRYLGRMFSSLKL